MTVREDKKPAAPGSRKVEAEVPVKASPEAIWEALSTGPGLQRWFAAHAEVQPGPGGSVTLGWAPGEDWVSRIDVWEPQARLVISSEMPGRDGQMVRLAVEFRIETEGGTTRVRLVQSGFGGDGSWDEMIDGTEAGWAYFMQNLRHCLERHPGAPRVLLSERPRCAAGVEEGWRVILGERGLALRDGAGPLPDPKALSPGRACTLRLGHETFDAQVLITRLPRTAAFLIPGLSDALLFLERESLRAEFQQGLWLSTYGLPEARTRDLQAQVTALADRLRQALPAAAQG